MIGKKERKELKFCLGEFLELARWLGTVTMFHCLAVFWDLNHVSVLMMLLVVSHKALAHRFKSDAVLRPCTQSCLVAGREILSGVALGAGVLFWMHLFGLSSFEFPF
ncbi:hypothetical protein TSUD_325170 [Trifolium subterraneum]|uniref:Uncharacterized protein n=1 Tax=Trifolium subterraneum TaxID=3900 RepID=A0A2Z6NH77_TRISU|nr:hypothetical protein TSUD_325170 [Trifolium subterraneum]